MISFAGLARYIALFALLSGVLIALLSNALLIIQNPTEKGAYIQASKNVGKMIFSSQNDIKTSINQINVSINSSEELPQNKQYTRFLLWRILGSSLITMGVIYILYKGISFFVPASGGDLGARLLVAMISIGAVWGVSLVYSLSTGSGWVMPFEGWGYMLEHAGILREGLQQAGYSTSLNKTLNTTVNMTG